MQTDGSVTVVDGRYELERELGRGPTGMVWRARDVVLGRYVALKIVHPSLADDVAFSSALADQVRRLASVDAAGLAKLLDIGEEDVLFLVHGFVEGESLRQRWSMRRRPDAGAVVRTAVALLHAVDLAHTAGVLHLHLSLDDVILTPSDEIVITDLAIGPAVVASRTADEAASILGPDVAPEIADGRATDERTDVWATGALVFEALTGERPNGRRSPRDVRPDVPRRLDRVVAKALSDDPGSRYATAAAFADALASSVADEVAGHPARRGVMRTWLAVPIGVGLVAALVIGAGLWVGRFEVGGPLGIRAADEPGGDPSPSVQEPSVATITPVDAIAFDPLGDGSENSSTAAAAIDGDEGTAWRSEAYRYPDGALGKDGVGLLLDLGGARDVSGFRLSTSHPGFTFHLAVGDDPNGLLDALGREWTADTSTRGEIEGDGRYLLVWVTTVVDAGDGNRAEIAEFRAVVAGDG